MLRRELTWVSANRISAAPICCIPSPRSSSALRHAARVSRTDVRVDSTWSRVGQLGSSSLCLPFLAADERLRMLLQVIRKHPQRARRGADLAHRVAELLTLRRVG